MRDLYENDETETWWRKPTVDRWVQGTIACAAVLTIVIAAIGPRVLWREVRNQTHLDATMFCDGLVMTAIFTIGASFLPTWRLSRLVRLAVLLPLVHLVLIAIAWQLWLASAHLARARSSLVDALPLLPTIVTLAAGTAAVARVIARGRREWSHAFAMLALVELLLVGLWLPIACWLRCRNIIAPWWGAPAIGLDAPVGIVVCVVAPPLLAASAYTALAIHHRGSLRRRTAIACVLGLVTIGAILRARASFAACVLYANLVHVMLATAVVAIGALAVLGITRWWRVHTARIRIAAQPVLHGVITHDDPDQPIVGCLEIASWLRGPRDVLRSFVVRTASGDVLIAGARFVAPIADITTRLCVGQSVAVLRAGDPIAITGLDLAIPGDPFRTSAAPIASSEVVVSPREPGPYGLADVALAIWRPSIAYLLILVAVAVPALAALVDG